MIFKANRGGAVGGAVLQIGAEAWNLPALSFLSCGSAQSSCVLLCNQSSSGFLRSSAYPGSFERYENNCDGHNKRQRSRYCAD
jgi:hypothetical protein